jgi:uncharacterized delta-60 repeat protein
MRRLTTIVLTAGVILAAMPAAASPGDLDPSFSEDGVAVTFPEGGVATAVAVDHEGRIVVGGYTLGGGVDVAIARFLRDGTRDATFGGGDGRIRVDVRAADYGLDLVVLPDDGIAVTGVSTDAKGRGDRPFVVRVGARGAPSRAFGVDGVVVVDFDRPSQATNAISITPKGRFVVGGFASNGTSTRTAVARLLPDGRLDGGFADDGRVLLDLSDGSETVHDILVLDDGRIVLAGEADVGLQPRFLLARLLGTGALDTTFGVGAGVTRTDLAPGADVALTLTRQPDGMYVLAGRAANGDRNDWGVARYGVRGRPDPTFAGDGSTLIRLTDAFEEATGVVPQGARLILVGRARAAGGLDLAVARLKSGGVLDPTFGGGDGLATVDVTGTTATGRAVALQTNGRIVVAGETWVGGTPRFLVARLRAG